MSVLLPGLSPKPTVLDLGLLTVLAFHASGSRRRQTASALAALAMHTPGAVASSSGPQKAHLRTRRLTSSDCRAFENPHAPQTECQHLTHQQIRRAVSAHTKSWDPRNYDATKHFVIGVDTSIASAQQLTHLPSDQPKTWLGMSPTRHRRCSSQSG